MREQNQIIQVFDTYLALPSGRMIPLDAVKTFEPTQEFWQLWRAHKIDVKRAGVGVTIDEDTGEWRGYVRSISQGFSYTQSDLHAYWTEKARKKAETERCGPAIVEAGELSLTRSQFPCGCHREYEVVAKICKNKTFQMRLKCAYCDAKTQGAIAWDTLGSELVITSIAYALQNASVRDLASGNFNFV